MEQRQHFLEMKKEEEQEQEWTYTQRESHANAAQKNWGRGSAHTEGGGRPAPSVAACAAHFCSAHTNAAAWAGGRARGGGFCCFWGKAYK